MQMTQMDTDGMETGVRFIREISGKKSIKNHGNQPLSQRLQLSLNSSSKARVTDGAPIDIDRLMLYT